MAEKPEKFAEGVGITPQWMAATAEKCIEENREIWGKMLTMAANYVAQGRRFSMETLFQFARYDCNARGVTAFKVDNNIRSTLARKMLKLHPSWAQYVDMRRSKVDML